MRQIRRGTFETNSSSTHSITFCSLDSWKKWMNGTTLFDANARKFLEFGELTAEDYIEAEKSYNNNKRKYYKDWETLSIEEKEEYARHCLALKRRYSNEYSQYDLLTYSDWCSRYNKDSLEVYHESYTTPLGDQIVAFGYYGYS